MSEIPGMQCIELIPGANHYVVPKEEDPNDKNKDGVVFVYKLNPDGSKGEFLGTMPAFPEGWDDPAKRKMTRNLRQQKNIEEEEGMRAVSLDKEKMVAKARELMSQGRSMNKAAQELGVPIGTLAYWLKKDKEQTPSPEPAEAVNQEPEREEVESAENSIFEKGDNTKIYKPQRTTYTSTQYHEQLKGFTLKDDVPKPWTEEDKQLAHRLRDEGYTLRQISDRMGFTYSQIKGFFERERERKRKQSKLEQTDVLDQYKAKWIRDIMFDDLDPTMQLQIVSAIQRIVLEVG
jgi:transposase